MKSSKNLKILKKFLNVLYIKRSRGLMIIIMKCSKNLKILKKCLNTLYIKISIDLTTIIVKSSIIIIFF